MNQEILTEKQVAEKYQLCTRTLNKWRNNNFLKEGLHFFYMGRQIRYNSIELQKYFENSSSY